MAMSPIARDYLIYGVASLIGFGVYLTLDWGFRIDFSIALLLGFVGVHASVILGRRFL